MRNNKISIFLSVLIFALSIMMVSCTDTENNTNEIMTSTKESTTIEGKTQEDTTEADTQISAETELVTESDDDDTVMYYDMDSVLIEGRKLEPTDIKDYELISIYECQKTDIELLTYKDEYGNFNNNIILKAHDRYFVYDERVLFYEIIDDIEQYEQYGHSLVNPVHYIEDDFDGDGDIELACAFIMDRGSAYMNEKLMIFDYNKAEDEYDLYCLRFADFSDMAASVIAKHYDSEYTYEEISDGADGGIDSLATMCMGRLYKEGAPSVSWGSWEEVTLDDGKPFKIIMHVYEYTGNCEELSKFVCNVSYLDNGEFAVEFADYSQDYINW